MMDFEQIIKKFKEKRLEHEVIKFEDEAVSARTRDTSLGGNYDPKNAIKTLIIKTKTGFVAVVLRGDQKIDDKKLESVVGKWSVVNAVTLENEFGFVAGSVCPLILEIPILLDGKVLALDVLSMGAGDIKKGLNVKLEVVKQYLKFEVVDITKEKNMNNEERLKLITRNCQEVLTVEDLQKLVESGKEINHYIGFEISGMVHLGTGLISMGKIADFIKAGVKCKLFLADFHSYLNNKLGGNWDNIRWATEHYFKQGLIASLKCFGVEENQVEWIMGKDLYAQHPEHWETFMRVGKQITLSRNLRSISIMGKKEGTEVDMATLFYPPLQVADIFTMNVNLAHAGIDQRKAHVIAREVGDKLPGGWTPVAIHQNLIAGLTGPTSGENDAETLKMSKSKPGSAIFVHDTPDEIREKIKKAYGPPKKVEYNPLLNWVKTLVFWGGKTGEFEIIREEKFGGNKKYSDYDEIENDYRDGGLFPLDLKNALSEWLIVKLEPARRHFEIAENRIALGIMKELIASK